MEGMSRQPPPTASGTGDQGAGGVPYVSSDNGYITVSPDVSNCPSERGRERLEFTFGDLTICCDVLKSECILEGYAEVLLVECNGDFYVAVKRDSCFGGGYVYEVHKVWTEDRAEAVVEEIAEEECVCCDSEAYDACYWYYEHPYAVQTILQFQEEAERLQRALLAREHVERKRAILEEEIAPEEDEEEAA